MNLKTYMRPVLVFILAGFTAISCTDDWDAHYNSTAGGKSDLYLFDYIQTQPDLSLFADMLKMSGYDKILNESSPYTVWAPSNESWSSMDGTLSLLALTMEDTAAVKNIVKNHIAHYSCPVSKAVGNSIRMLNGKLFPFIKSGSDYLFGGVKLQTSDVSVQNGILHTLTANVPYRLNLWEHILYAPGIDAIQTYAQSLFESTLDVSKSYQDGIFVDSVFKTTNKMLTYLGDMNVEDSIYTTIIPDDNAWNDAYDRISPFYNTLEKDGGVEAQMANTKWTIVRDLVFRKRLTPPLADGALYSTYGHKFLHPDSLFMGSDQYVLSNGYAYRTSKLWHNPADSWFKEIRVEAETFSETTGQKSNYTISSVSSLGSSLDVSNQHYITCDPMTSSSISKLFVKFPIPNTLSAKYNIYVVFVPTAVVDTSDHRPYKVNCYLSYVNSNGKVVTDSKLTLAANTTNPDKMTKMLVAKNFEFPYCNIVDQPDMVNSTLTSLTSTNKKYTTVYLKVENAAGVTTADLAAFNRKIRIDCIILEPVQ